MKIIYENENEKMRLVGLDVKDIDQMSKLQLLDYEVNLSDEEMKFLSNFFSNFELIDLENLIIELFNINDLKYFDVKQYVIDLMSEDNLNVIFLNYKLVYIYENNE